LDTNVKTIKVPLRKAIQVISENFKEAKNQRPTKIGNAGDFMLSVIHWTNFESIENDLIENLFSDSKDICSDKPIFIKLAYSQSEKGFEIQDGQFRVKSLIAILENAVSVPTKTNIVAYKWAVDKYGGMYFKDLPKSIQQRFENATIVITIIETDDFYQRSALFYGDNCGARLSTKDALNNNYCNTKLWIVINNFVSFIKNRAYLEENEFNLNLKQYRILHDIFGKMTHNTMLNFFVRNFLAINGWESYNQSKVCEELFETNRNSSYNNSLMITKRMAKQLIYVQKFFVCEDRGLTLYTSMIGFAFGYLDKKGRDFLDERCEIISREISRWSTIGLHSNEMLSDSILAYMSNAYCDITRLNRAKEFFKDTYSKLVNLI